ncbi:MULTISPECIES: glycosyltransferase [unclassified Fusibacter]|uniref:glycosyltransferase n=1 Tax=unclassified Fusibacter TaxID=2624464 RepID=UPI001010C329|nr:MULTISPECIES: glycosyltransferase [unclassified Fusibacter]MCK8061252.1 hypothetical protein [Fusibacter sp. A2]NPE23404.1 hypothetical protein [Fusibacter sp. A1]
MLSLYTNYFEKNKIKYDIICANKYDDNYLETANKIYEFDAKKTINSNVFAKLAHFWKMRNFAKKIIDNNKYDYIIVWNQVTAFIFSDILIKQYRKKYCINVRDYHYDDNPLIKYRITPAIREADFNTVSSEAFKKFLPDGEYLTIHSLNKKMLNQLEPRNHYRSVNEKINILNIGQIRWPENIFPMIEELKNDSRYIMTFVGQGSHVIEEYIKGRHIENVIVHGRFEPIETIKYLKDADILFNLYGTGNLHVDTALSIKLYYAIYLNIPILTYNGTYIGEVSNTLGIGYCISKNSFEGLADNLHNWYHTRDINYIKETCSNFIEEIEQSHEKLYRRLDEILAKS